ncbi:hypothetical protein P153DRAFT_161831 [Dothidotthia symphoricarpi CBS 119687]|uniref:C2H2-type domain-containing protein n=1 Tax=Dothidotthia symphoricarpi CBS 119687 TaxID=1392245 RepID=A0A6A5ZX88_9PLEO|nr:uncharacterized protein P153DRAFT_161831 [Dothidotthia symphoricarpi CBS 119687]KAF2123534.1 hypothetical protein P153DRAFT_161831 [Dothidotthia symphoricarpi CBS 119687]
MPDLRLDSCQNSRCSTPHSNWLTDDYTIQCGQCDVRFTGKYRRGNLARHVRHKHSESRGGPYTCSANGCSKVYRRQDAKLKHERQRHAELHCPQEQSRHSLPIRQGSFISSIHQVIDSNEQSKPPFQGETLAQTAQVVFSQLYTKLDYDDYTRFCDAFLAHWEAIVQELRNKNSDAHTTYARVLEEIYTVVSDLDSAPPNQLIQDDELTRSSGMTYQPALHAQDQFYGAGHLSLCPGVGSSSWTSQAHGRDGQTQQYQKSQTGGEAWVIHSDKPITLKSRNVDCPIYKHNSMHGTPLSCRGCSNNRMSQIRNHVNRSTHSGFPRFLKQCGRCREDFIDRQLFNSHRDANRCEYVRQIRGNIEIPWARLYLTIFPNAPQVPLPYTGEFGWLPEDVTAQCRPLGRTVSRSHSFLGEELASMDGDQTQSQSMNDLIVNRPDYHAVLNFMLSDAMNPMEQELFQTHQADPNRAVSEGVIARARPDDASAHYLSILEREPDSFLRAFIMAPRFLSSERLQFMADLAEAFYNATQTYRNRPSNQIYAPDVADSTPSYHGFPMHHQDPVAYAPPYHQPIGVDEYYGGHDMSTQPSSQGVDSNSAPFGSTQPSTAPDPSDPTLLSPFNSGDYRRTSLASTGVPEVNLHPAGLRNVISSPSNQHASPDVSSYSGLVYSPSGDRIDYGNVYDPLLDLTWYNWPQES